MGALPIIGGLLGLGGSVAGARENRRAAEEAREPRPYNETSTSGPPQWLLPFIQDLPGLANDLLQNQIRNPRLPPTFNQAIGGGYQSAFPSSVAGGMQPGWTHPELQRVFDRTQERINQGDNPRELSDRERQQIAEAHMARHPELFQAPSPSPGGGPRPRPFRGGGGGGFGGGGGGGFGGGGIGQMGNLLMNRAQQGLPPAAQQGLGFLGNLLGQGPDLSAINRGLMQQQQTFDDFRNPSSPISRFIQRGMGGGFSSAAAMQRQLASGLLGGMSAPPQALPTSRFQSFLDMARGPGGDFRVTDFGQFP